MWVKRYADLRYALTVNRGNDVQGEVHISPEPDDPNLPTYAPDELDLPRYPAGTEVTLTATTVEHRHFSHWNVYDPNHPGDANYAVADSNNPITPVMDANQEVTFYFKCGSGLTPLLPMIVGVMGLAGFARRRR
jgi:hypothetical protein